MPKKLTVREKNKRIAAWVAGQFADTKATKLKAADLAEQAERALGFFVSDNRMCRELYKQDVKFKPDPDDPPRRTFTKVDLLLNRVNGLEERVRKLEGTPAPA